MPAEPLASSIPDEDRPAPVQPVNATIALIQKTLNEHGYDAGPVDGILGPRTRTAIRQYEADRGLPVDGEITPALRAQLVRDIARGPASAPRRRESRQGHLNGDLPPRYEVGDTYVYTGGRVETVAAVEGDRVVWRGATGARFSTHRNFILPVSSWAPSASAVAWTVDAAPDALWPLTPGETVSFTARGVPAHSADGDGGSRLTESWRCRVEGTETVEVPAGTFDTFRITCRRAPVLADAERHYVWNYAPDIRHYVRREEIQGGELRKRVELAAIRLGGSDWPAAARAGLGWARDDALETKPDGGRLKWRSSGVEATVVIEPTASFRNDAGARCRTFRMIRSRDGEERIYPALACRDEESDRWSIPGLEPPEVSAR